jgi:hypothetical protein
VAGSNTPAIVQQKLQLLEKLSTLDRGALASSIDRYEVESLVRPLEQARGMLPFEGEPAAIDGKWQLVYSSVEAFRSSPFFWAFPSLVGGDRQLAAQIFAFTDSIPGAEIGPAYQTISLASGQLVSEVELRVWPGVSGYVVTTSRLAAAGESGVEVATTAGLLVLCARCVAAHTTAASTLGIAWLVPVAASCHLAHALPLLPQLTVESTRVANSNVLPQLFDAITVPVEQLLQQVRGSEAAKASARVTYLDRQMRVTRTLPDNALFIYRRAL